MIILISLKKITYIQMANSLRLEIIKGYLATVNFAGDDWSYHIIEEDLKTKLGERPTLNIKKKERCNVIRRYEEISRN